ANEFLAAENSISRHTIVGLQMALLDEKKRQKRGKPLNLLGEAEFGPQFFSPGRIVAARAYQEEKEKEKEEKQREIGNKKAQQAANKLQKDKEKEERALVATERRKIAAEAKAAKAANIQSRKNEREKAAAAKIAKTKQPKNASTTEKGPGKSTKATDLLPGPVVLEVEGVAILETSRGRKVQPPKRFAN
ncbi:MAG: hypothetical protein M1829_002692, partial [Trizodia sp. TS-e1964]